MDLLGKCGMVKITVFDIYRKILNNNFVNQLSNEERKTPEVYFVGNSISGIYLAELMGIIGDRDFSINVISKSTEPAIAFRILKEKLVAKYGKYETALYG